jgi:histone deacetylase 11
MHHASYKSGGGWCVYSDISISIKSLISQNKIKKAMIIDLDAHQGKFKINLIKKKGNGYENDKLDGIIDNEKNSKNIFIVDLYNSDVYPDDKKAMKAIDIEVKLNSKTSSSDYLIHLKDALDKSLKKFQPDIIYYNAGTDILVGDKLGHLNVEIDDVVKRDEMVFDYALNKFKTPIVMVLSGGYQENNASVIAKSIENLKNNLKLF